MDQKLHSKGSGYRRRNRARPLSLSLSPQILSVLLSTSTDSTPHPHVPFTAKLVVLTTSILARGKGADARSRLHKRREQEDS